MTFAEFIEALRKLGVKDDDVLGVVDCSYPGLYLKVTHEDGQVHITG